MGSGPVVSLLFATVLYFTVGAIAFPVLPRYVEQELGGSNTDIGLAFGAMTVGMLLLRPFVSYLTDRWGRRSLIVIGSLGVAVAQLLHVPAGDLGGLPLVMGVRFLNGLAASALYVGMAIVATEIGPRAKQGQIFSAFSAAVYVGFSIGPVLGEVLLDAWGFGPTFAVSGAIAVACAVVTITLPETRPDGVEPSMDTLGDLFHPIAARVGTVNLMVFLAFMGFNAFIAPYGESIGVGNVRWILLTFALVSLGMRLIGGSLIDRANRVVLGTVCQIGVAAAALILGLVDTELGLYLGAFVMGLGLSLNVPLLMVVATESTDELDRSKVVATVVFFGDIANSAGVLFLGVIADVADYRTMYIVLAVMTVLATLVMNSRFMDPVTALRRS